MIKIIECPRDAMQGLHHLVPADVKAEYLNALLHCGFDTLDAGSFVSPKAIPQMADTAEVFDKLIKSPTKILAIIANIKGAENACVNPHTYYLGYPFSISETFQQRNTNRSMADAYNDLKTISAMAKDKGKELVTYISMGFGNPYGDVWSADVVSEWVEKLLPLGIHIFSMADTVGAAVPEDIHAIFTSLQKRFGGLEFGAHFHSTPLQQTEKLSAAYEAGCRRFDTALLGFGGCPMADDVLTGNINTLTLLDFLVAKGEELNINAEALELATYIAREKVFTGA